jgi:hypothetical protein
MPSLGDFVARNPSVATAPAPARYAQTTGADVQQEVAEVMSMDVHAALTDEQIAPLLAATANR